MIISWGRRSHRLGDDFSFDDGRWRGPLPILLVSGRPMPRWNSDRTWRGRHEPCDYAIPARLARSRNCGLACSGANQRGTDGKTARTLRNEGGVCSPARVSRATHVACRGGDVYRPWGLAAHRLQLGPDAVLAEGHRDLRRGHRNPRSWVQDAVSDRVAATLGSLLLPGLPLFRLGDVAAGADFPDLLQQLRCSLVVGPRLPAVRPVA